jgi:isopenicillin-N N-acyltransferase like protein
MKNTVFQRLVICLFLLVAGSTGGRSAEAVPVVELSGADREIGRQHARALAEPMKELHGRYLMAYFEGRPAERFVALQLAKGFERHLLPEHHAEVAALAEEAGLEMAEAMLAQSFLDMIVAVGCSTIALPAEAAPDGVARFGRNLDFPTKGIAHKHSVLMVYRPEGRYRFAAIGWPGMVGVLSGMNEHGLTLANMEVPRAMRLPTAMPYTLLYRMVLEQCRTVEEALELLKQTPRQSANNLMLMDAAGDRAVVELTPEAVVVRRAEADQPLLSTNHHRGEDHATTGRCWRYDSLQAATADHNGGGIDPAMLQRMLDDVSQGEVTMQSMVFEPANRMIYLAADENATRKSFQKIDLSQFFE